MQKTSIRPVGNEVRPGVWIAAGARVHRSARLVAPCYIGTSAKIRAGALITRGTSIENHCVVDCGSVIESSTLLPLSYVGKGLDLTHSLLGSHRVFSVKYGAEMDVEDATLISTLPSTSALRTLQDAANLVAFIPRQIVRSIFGEPKQRESQVDSTCPSSGTFEPASVVPPVNKRNMPSSVVAGVREYGNQ
jgi:NDP-sugar pyrophosphorylase family protein